MKEFIVRNYSVKKKLSKKLYGAVHQEALFNVLLTETPIESKPSKELIAKLETNKNVLKILDIIDVGDCCYFACEQYGDKSLLDYAIESGKLNETITRNILKEILAGYEVFYNNQVVHQNILPQNILVDTNKQIAKIGMCNNVSHLYSAPEVSSVSDIWSIGAVVYFMLHGYPPFKHKKSIQTGYYFVRKDLSSACIDLLISCLRKDPKKRITYEELKSHPFIIGIKQKLIDLNKIPCTENEFYLSAGEEQKTIRRIEKKLLMGGKNYIGVKYLCRCGEEDDVLLKCGHYVCIGCAACDRVTKLDHKKMHITCPFCKLCFKMSIILCIENIVNIRLRCGCNVNKSKVAKCIKKNDFDFKQSSIVLITSLELIKAACERHNSELTYIEQCAIYAGICLLLGYIIS